MPNPESFDLSLPHRSHLDSLLLHFGERPGILLDSGGTIAAANPQAAALFGRSAEELAGSPLSLLNPLFPAAEFDVVTPSIGFGTVKVVRATTLPPHDGHDYVSVVLEAVTTEEPALAEVVLLALVEASQISPKCCLNVSLSFPPGIRASAEARGIVRDFIVMLSDFASSQEASLHLSGVEQDGWMELRLRLVEPNPADQPVDWDSSSCVPDHAADRLLKMGGEFRVANNYPETTVWLTLPAVC